MITGSPLLRVLDVSYNDIGDDGISLCLQYINNVADLGVAKCGLSVKGSVYCVIVTMHRHLS